MSYLTRMRIQPTTINSWGFIKWKRVHVLSCGWSRLWKWKHKLMLMIVEEARLFLSLRINYNLRIARNWSLWKFEITEIPVISSVDPLESLVLNNGVTRRSFDECLEVAEFRKAVGEQRVLLNEFFDLRSVIRRRARSGRITDVRTEERPFGWLSELPVLPQVAAFREDAAQLLLCLHSRLQITQRRIASFKVFLSFIYTTHVLFNFKIHSLNFTSLCACLLQFIYARTVWSILLCSNLFFNLIFNGRSLEPFWISEMVESHGPGSNRFWSNYFGALSSRHANAFLSNASNFVYAFLQQLFAFGEIALNKRVIW